MVLDLLDKLVGLVSGDECQFLQPYREKKGRYAKTLFHAQQKFVSPFVRLDVEAVHRVAHGGFRLEERGGEVVGEASTSFCLMAGLVVVSGEKERPADFCKEQEVAPPRFLLKLLGYEDCEVLVPCIVE